MAEAKPKPNLRSVMLSKINDVQMDGYDLADEYIGTYGVSSCICFIVFLGNGKVFLEHRSDTYLSSNFSKDNVSLCLQNLVEHVLSYDEDINITVTVILGGFKKQNRFQKFEDVISHLITNDNKTVGVDDDNESTQYKQLLSNIKWADPRINVATDSPHVTGECSIEVIVDQYSGDQLIILRQHVKLLDKWDIVIGVVVIGLVSKTRCFAINPIARKRRSDENRTALDFRRRCIVNLRDRMKKIDAEEVKDETSPRHLFKSSKLMARKLTNKLSTNEKELDYDDQVMCGVFVENNNDNDDDFDEEQ